MLGINLPLALIGVGFLIHLLFKAASYALPLFAGTSAGFAAAHAGMSGSAALLIGFAAFLLVVAVGTVVHLLLPRYARIALALLFAVPAAIAGFQVASALSHLASAGTAGTAAAMVAALITGGAAAKRLGTASRA